MAAPRAALPARAGLAEVRPEAASGRAEAQSFPFRGTALSAALQKAVSELLARPAAGAAVSAAEVLPPEGAAEASGAEVEPRREAAARAAAVLRLAEALQAARPSEQPRAARP